MGQERVVRNLELAARSARERGEALGHVLLEGAPGLGKTTLARALAREMGARLHAAVGPFLAEVEQLAALLTGLEPRDILFIDEIHRLPVAAAECLHAAMEDRVLDVVVAEGIRARTIRIVLAPFTLVGATTEPGTLAEAFRSRFRLEERLEPYRPGEIATLVERAAGRLGTPASAGACVSIARRARGTPREAVRLLERARDLAQAAGATCLEAEHVDAAAERSGIDAEGLRSEERCILELLLARGRPLGIETLAAALRLDARTIRRVHEPYLLERGYLERSPRGRRATREARRRFGSPGLAPSPLPASSPPRRTIPVFTWRDFARPG